VISFVSVSVIYSVADPNPDPPDPHVFGLLESNPNPDPLVRGLDPQIRIHTKMLWIRNTGFFKCNEDLNILAGAASSC
jgi:hypothetical protein